MSPLMTATIEWIETLHQETGQEPKRIVLPRRAHDMLRRELAELAQHVEPVEVPVSGEGLDGRLWLACTELVVDADDGAAPP